ncbi:hypothetical protein GCM10007385_27100 [Tateyamaria omphalii]|uniref:hypothetical protein n=1 Tax=Tateyamaria omphalii TaxID=299262 RepID=UPI00167AADE6|nr:hypothetical protein [Tateyamaria omphalii]GGX56893.1 hypothetical protein GCM10007385_27100 [Tateyamaria omphalii]
MRWLILSVCVLSVAGCDALPRWAGGAQPAPVVEQPAEDQAGELETGLDDVVEDQPLPDPDDAQEVSIGTLGRTVASLGNAAEPGLWLKTPLVSVEQSGRVYYAETNTTVDVTLIPIDGPRTAGSRLSLQAMQALGAPLTGLPEVDVFGA